MQVAIVEDEPTTQMAITTVFRAAAKQMGDLQWQCFASGEALLFALPEHTFDLVLLDIRLAGIDGMTTAKKIRQKDADLPLAFLSNYDQYVFDGYDVSAIGYLLKPLTLEKLLPLLAKVTKAKLQPALMVQTTAGLEKVFFYDVRFIEVQVHDCLLHLQERVVTVKQPLSELATQLDDRFVKTHRAYLVNLGYVSALDGAQLTLNDGTTLPVARGQKQAVRQALLAHYRGLAHE